MTERNALALLREDRSGGLEWFIDRYTPYVSAIVWNILGRTMTAQDVEEVTSDAFVTLWRNRERAKPGQVKGYLGQIARTRAINKLRQEQIDLELEEDVLVLPGADPETLAEGRERDSAVRAAVQAMDEPDREIFVRHYYYCETAQQIAQYVGLTPAAVRQRLRRGRERLRDSLMKGGDSYDLAIQ